MYTNQDFINYSEALRVTVESLSQQSISYDGVACLESAIPSHVTRVSNIHGLTDNPSLENFQKVKDAIKSFIDKLIEKIKSLLSAIRDWWNNKDSGAKNSKETAKEFKETASDFEKAAEKYEQTHETKPAGPQKPKFNPYENDEDKVRSSDGENIYINFSHEASRLINLTSDQIVDLIKYREATADEILLKVLQSSVDIPLLWMDLSEQDTLLKTVVNTRWDSVLKGIKLYARAIEMQIDFPKDRYGFNKDMNRAGSDGYYAGYDDGMRLEYVLPVIEKLADKYIPDDSKYRLRYEEKYQDAEKTDTLYAYLTPFFKDKKHLHGGAGYNGTHQKIRSVEHLTETIEQTVHSYSRSIEECLAPITEAIDIMQNLSKKIQASDQPDLYKAKYGGYNFNQTLLLLLMLVRVFNYLAKAFSTIIANTNKIIEKFKQATEKLQEST